MKHELGVCASCGRDIYLNLTPGRSVDVWCHRATGGKYCDLTEVTVALPADRPTEATA